MFHRDPHYRQFGAEALSGNDIEVDMINDKDSILHRRVSSHLLIDDLACFDECNTEKAMTTGYVPERTKSFPGEPFWQSHGATPQVIVEAKVQKAAEVISNLRMAASRVHDYSEPGDDVQQRCSKIAIRCSQAVKFGAAFNRPLILRLCEMQRWMSGMN